jgi:small-conductance mechanosensitive channel
MRILLLSEALVNTDFIDKMYFGNSVLDYLIALTIILVGVAAIAIAKKIITKKLSRIDSPFIVYYLKVDDYVYPLIYLLNIYVAINWLTIQGKASTFIHYVFTVSFIFLSIRLFTAVIRTAIHTYLIHQDETGEKLKEVNGIVLILNVILWVIGLIFLFDNLGFNVTAVITGLGIGGIAIALAAQTILGDIFNYFVIFFDRPFEVGDFIIVNDVAGTIEYTGLKTTRIKSLAGEQIIFSNTNLTNSRIHNYKRMQDRRVVFKFGVIYEVGKEKLAAIPAMVRTIIEKQENVRFDRAHFFAFGDYSLNFEVVYYVLGSDYTQYMDIQQSINLMIYEEFENKGIAFAYPTYLVNMKRGDNE